MTFNEQINDDLELYGSCYYTNENGVNVRIDPTKLVIVSKNKKRTVVQVATGDKSKLEFKEK